MSPENPRSLKDTVYNIAQDAADLAYKPIAGISRDIRHLAGDISGKTSLINQTVLIDKLQYIQRWMEFYEKESRKRDTGSEPLKHELTQITERPGLCFGLSVYLAHCVRTEQQIAQKKAAGEPINTDPYTTDVFFQKLHDIINAEVPLIPAGAWSATNKKTMLEFHHKMQLFMLEITQLQASLRIDKAKQSFSEILAETSSSPTRQQTYFMNSKNQLIKWGKEAEAGDVLYIQTIDAYNSGHAMIAYVKTNEQGEKLVGFYDPNNPDRIEVPQATLTRNNIRAFNPFEYSLFTSCQYFSDNQTKVIDIQPSKTIPIIKILDRLVQLGDSNTLLTLSKTNPAMLTTLDSAGLLPITYAIRGNNITLVQDMIALNPDLLTTPSTQGLLPIHYAADRGSTDLFKTILTHDEKLLNIPDKNGITPIIHACDKKQIDLVIELTKRYPQLLHAVDGKNKTLAHHAALTNNLLFLQYLAPQDPTILLDKVKEMTPIHIAIFNAHVKKTDANNDTICSLIKLNPDIIHTKTKLGTSFLEFVRAAKPELLPTIIKIALLPDAHIGMPPHITLPPRRYTLARQGSTPQPSID